MGRPGKEPTVLWERPAFPGKWLLSWVPKGKGKRVAMGGREEVAGQEIGSRE